MTDLEIHRHPSLAIDLVILVISEGQLCAVVLPRDDLGNGTYALPGGFVHHGQSLDQTVARVLAEKTGLAGITFEQLATYGDPWRDPRGHVVSVAYLALLPDPALADGLPLAEIRVTWPGEAGGPATAHARDASLKLAFDHAAILGDTVKRLRGKIDYSRIAFSLLPARFTLRQVQEVHEAILGRPLLKPAFRRKLLDQGILRATGDMESGSAFRPAALYELVRPTLE
jgi:8-oxo-dGTP diphosphatase